MSTKLDLMIIAIEKAKQITPKGNTVTVFISQANLLNRLYPEEIRDTLEKLEVDEKILKLVKFPSWRMSDNRFLGDLRGLHFEIETLENFDCWCDEYWLEEGKWLKILRPKITPKTTHEDKIVSPKTNAVYCITFTKAREILLNDSYQIAKPDFDRENEQVFKYLYEHPNGKFTKEQIETELKQPLVKPFHKIVENLGFKGVLRAVFFDVSQDSIRFKNPVKSGDLSSGVLSGLNSLTAKG